MSDLCLDCGICCTTLFFSHVPLEDDELVTLPSQIRVERRTDDRPAFRLPCVAHQNYRCTVYTQRPKICRGYHCDLLLDEEAGRVSPTLARQVVAETKKRFEAVETFLATVAPEPTYLIGRISGVIAKAQSAPAETQLPDSFVKDAHELAQLMQGFFKRREFLPDFKNAEATRAAKAAATTPSGDPPNPP